MLTSSGAVALDLACGELSSELAGAPKGDGGNTDRCGTDVAASVKVEHWEAQTSQGGEANARPSD
jgi:hypothetical protein